MIFNDSASGDPAVCIFEFFGADKETSTNGDFTVSSQQQMLVTLLLE
ncbi:MAG: hypothetical protein CM15mV96_440 [uncultured marine virus]|nr:MAG: hypothetical protein CM15mV96_440 [uncultured marine virus]